MCKGGRLHTTSADPPAMKHFLSGNKQLNKNEERKTLKKKINKRTWSAGPPAINFFLSGASDADVMSFFFEKKKFVVTIEF